LESAAESPEKFLNLKRSNDVKKQCCLSALGEPSPHFLEKQISRFSPLPEHLHIDIQEPEKGLGWPRNQYSMSYPTHHLSGIQSVRQDNPPSGIHDPALSSKQDISISMRITRLFHIARYRIEINSPESPHARPHAAI
jgi:hypothetical protein